MFIGRLTREKGVNLLMSAWARSLAGDTQQLVVAGDGPERDSVLASRGINVRYEGFVDAARLHQLLDETAIVVIPSLCYEGFPGLSPKHLSGVVQSPQQRSDRCAIWSHPMSGGPLIRTLMRLPP